MRAVSFDFFCTFADLTEWGAWFAEPFRLYVIKEIKEL